jgi:D-tyrosyl-tRNA(Tyr) deacylase
MRLVIQRVARASVTVDSETVGRIGPGLLIFAGVAAGDEPADAARLAAKTAEMRIFNDADGRFNLSLLETGGEALVVSQFTLIAELRRGRRPSFNGAAVPDAALPVFEAYATALASLGVHVERGRFGAHMDVELLNDGPVTIVLDSADLDRPRRG